MPHALVGRLVEVLGVSRVSVDPEVCRQFGQDGTRQSHAADVVVFPDATAQVSAIARICSETRTPMVARGAGTGYSGGAVPVRGGVVLAFERMNRIIAIDEASLYAIVEPGVVTGDLQDAVAGVGLFYPPDPSSLRQCTIGGNVAENAGGPRAFKYGVTRHYVLGLEAVLPSGEVIRTGGKTVKNVVGYDLTQLLVGSEGTLAIVTEITLRLVSLPPAVVTLRAFFPTIHHAAEAVSRLVRQHAVPATLELVDGATLDAVAKATGDRTLAPAGAGAMLIVECDGLPQAVDAEAAIVAAACRAEGATGVVEARTEAERDELWRARRTISPALMVIAGLKINNDIVVPRALVPDLFALVDDLKRRFRLPIPSFGHAGDGNIHVNVMANPDDADQVARAYAAVEALLDGVLALGGSISGEHGIGLSKAAFIDRELSVDTLAAMRRLKQSFDPMGILNPGKIFPEFAPAPVERAVIAERRS
jgi:glycolate oxidase